MIDTKRKRQLIYRANHRGTKEMDILLGRFATERVPGMSTEELLNFEQLLQCADSDLIGWITGLAPAPAVTDPNLLAAIVRFAEGEKGS